MGLRVHIVIFAVLCMYLKKENSCVAAVMHFNVVACIRTPYLTYIELSVKYWKSTQNTEIIMKSKKTAWRHCIATLLFNSKRVAQPPFGGRAGGSGYSWTASHCIYNI